MGKAFERRAWGAVLVLAASAASAVSVRKFVKPTPETAPAYRQKGPAEAPIVIAEFSDFECPACRAAEPKIKNLMSLYDGKIRFLFKHYPLTPWPHPSARQAAVTAECAGRQGKFWEIHDLLYEHQSEWAKAKDPAEELAKLAVKSGADEKALRACLQDASAAAPVDLDKKEGTDRWIGSTPTFFINQKRFAGADSFANAGTIWIDKTLRSPK